MSNVQHIFRQAGAPVTTPIGSAHHYVNTSNGDNYYSRGSSSPADWELINLVRSVNGLTGSISLTGTLTPFTPNGDISATNVQAAIVEVRDDTDTKLTGKANTVHTHVASDITDYNAAWDARLATKTTTNLTEGVNLYYTSARFDTAFAGKTTTDLTEGTRLYYTQARFDTAFAAKSTTNLAEGTNLYYTQARFDTAFAAKSTTNLTEGTNLYYTQARFDTAFTAKSTTNLSEGTNLYFTDERAQDAVGTILTDTATIDMTYNDAGNTISAIVIDASITFAKFQNQSASTLHGRSAGTSGVTGEITLGTGLRFIGSVLNTDTFFDVGDGEDGSATISGTTTLTRDTYYTDLTISATGTLIADGFKVYVNGTLTIAAGGVLKNNGVAGGNSATTGAGATGPGANVGSVGGGGNGTAGIAGTTGAGAQATAPGNQNPSMGSGSGAGGAGGSGTSGAGGASRAASSTTVRLHRYLSQHLIYAVTLLNGGAGGPGGSSGAGDGVNSGRGGGGGGGGGGVVFVSCMTLNNAGSIQANGGAGGNAGTGGAGNIGGAGGGAGGGGGWAFVVARVVTAAGTIQASGGAGGTFSSGVGTGTNGTSGGAGVAGRTSLYELSTKTWTVT